MSKILIMWVILISVIIIGGYFGSLRGDLGGIDAAVEDMAVNIGGREPGNPITLTERGENIAFTLAGMAAGLVIGYCSNMLMSVKVMQ